MNMSPGVSSSKPPLHIQPASCRQQKQVPSALNSLNGSLQQCENVSATCQHTPPVTSKHGSTAGMPPQLAWMRTQRRSGRSTSAQRSARDAPAASSRSCWVPCKDSAEECGWGKERHWRNAAGREARGRDSSCAQRRQAGPRSHGTARTCCLYWMGTSSALMSRKRGSRYSASAPLLPGTWLAVTAVEVARRIKGR